MVIRGKVVDVQGLALSGVAVALQGTEYQDVTDGVGGYVLRCPPGPIDLQFMKTGYTPGHLAGQSTSASSEDANGWLKTVNMTDMLLWPLPPGNGVYLFEEYRFRETARTEPKRYLPKQSGGVVAQSGHIFATKLEPTLETMNTFGGPAYREEEPLLICYKLPAYDVCLYRLEQIEAALPRRLGYATAAQKESGEKKDDAPRPSAFTETVWAPTEAVSISAVPIDEPGRLLLELRPAAPLPPGVYAVHWGALDGHITTDPRIFLFRITDPDAQGEGEPEDGEEPEANQ